MLLLHLLIVTMMMGVADVHRRHDYDCSAYGHPQPQRVCVSWTPYQHREAEEVAHAQQVQQVQHAMGARSQVAVESSLEWSPPSRATQRPATMTP